MGKYPMTFSIETPDGGGEAVKDKADEPWYVTYPNNSLRWYGSVPSMQSEVRKRIRIEMDYAKDAPITFTKEGG